MLSHLLKDTSVIVSTGNVLNVSELRKKAGQKPTDELTDCLRSTFGEADVTELPPNRRLITRRNNDLLEKVKEHPRADIKIGAKIFLNRFSEPALTEAVEKLFETLNVSYLDNLILAYHPTGASVVGNGNGGTAEPGEEEEEQEVKEGVIEWAVGSDNAVGNLKKLWSLLERYAGDGKIGQLGIADLDADSLKELYDASTVHPSIAQINLAACCVVPPQLQAYCNQNEIQLLTHSDPQELLPREVLDELDLASYGAGWTSRYQVHIKCRGVLAAKGFIVSLDRSN
ncbi:glutamate--cysteine ligase regulatory subunit [Anopheles arabiensis]|uniref:GCS light chain n=1 Tax=Anopheles arabiensis TaxID=7173 RepID=A0A182HHX2_ANOAR|nr:glutamate--cysteine ligase regulatory subunit [Anopheles arabiensis]XP_040161693.1 glutamate--cysteine ligase regulatory subunit [Anopheles arabiensis]XP_040161694.1 glutamate--cysteine ligase regulatory subunit [Anopheles arabiensis]XP_040161695.1 glutamate--cysteine ligase regulatory subunit [Anopheles arabiensis]XP_040161696.1 glutamate--cysteine ligase regulatory subunit [Anopheles arabiensis]XP_061509416.1 glutamate--cysteine ligase regulatory subunit [Anopheles gambiae]XP_061509417.1